MKRRWALVLAGLLGGVGVLYGVAQYAVLPSLDEELAEMEVWRPPTTCRVYDREGELMDEFALVRRIWVDIDDLPDIAWQALVAAEDRRFFEHHGVDWLGIVRALWVNIRAGGIREGASTLTQQLVKNIVVGKERSLSRKLREALLAWRLEQKLSKRDILELYLNYVYLGSGNYGMEAAAKDYFGISARELNPGQAALLAGLIPAPSAYSPRRDAQVARERRRIVLNSLVSTGMLDVTYGELYKREPIDPPRRVAAVSWDVGAAYRTAVRREVRRLLGREVPFQAGLQVHTPYDATLQDVAERAIQEAARAVERRQGHRGRDDSLEPEQVAPFLTAAKGLRREGAVVQRPLLGDCFPAVYQGGRRVAAGPFAFRVDAGSWWSRMRNPDSRYASDFMYRLARRGDVYEVCMTAKGEAELQSGPWVEGAAAVLENDTGRVVALVGGRNDVLEGFNRATQGRRQAGSSFKPYVFAAAIEEGATQVDRYLDAPIVLGRGRSIWTPRNASGGYQGLISMRQAFAWSSNTVAIRLAMEAGIDDVISMARRSGIRTRLRRDYTLALGSSEVSVLDQAVGFATFARLGYAIPPVFVDRLVDVRGDEVGRAGAPVTLPDVEVSLPGPSGEQVMRPATAWQVLDLMRGVVNFGTGTAAWREGRDRGGKTGTTSDFADAWFVGFTTTHTIAVWIGQDVRVSLGKGESGGRVALPAWSRIADALPEAPASLQIMPPDDIVLVPWDGGWVGLTEDHVPPRRLPWRHPGDAPLRAFPSEPPEDCTNPEGQATP